MSLQPETWDVEFATALPGQRPGLPQPSPTGWVGNRQTPIPAPRGCDNQQACFTPTTRMNTQTPRTIARPSGRIGIRERVQYVVIEFNPRAMPWAKGKRPVGPSEGLCQRGPLCKENQNQMAFLALLVGPTRERRG
jgi:hypothetical protein